MALMKKRPALSFVMMVVLVAILQLHARVEFVSAQDGDSSSGGGKPCCDHCICTKSWPPQCQCTDVGVTCHPGCKLCLCAYSEPPQCRCRDIKPYCYEKCTAAPYAPILEAIATAV